MEVCNSEIWSLYLKEEADEIYMHASSASEVDLTVSDKWMANFTVKKMEDKKKEFPDLYMGHIDMIDRHNHQYTPNSPRVGEGVKIADKLILSIFQALPEDVVLLLHGDHGSDGFGNHGGDKPEQHFTVFMTYSPKHKFRIPVQPDQFN